VRNGVNEKNASSIIRRRGGSDSHRRRSLCAGNAPIALQRRELSCRSDVAWSDRAAWQSAARLSFSPLERATSTGSR
jgi:hypothetical protein